jgi:hypothetical protein
MQPSKSRSDKPSEGTGATTEEANDDKRQYLGESAMYIHGV